MSWMEWTAAGVAAFAVAILLVVITVSYFEGWGRWKR